MQLTDDELGQIIAKASTLSERLNGDFIPVKGDERLAHRRLNHWKQLTSGGENDKWFDVNLLAFGKPAASDMSLLAWLGKVERKPENPWPAWALSLNAIVQAVSKAFADNEPIRGRSHSSHLNHASVPFESLLRPIVDDAWKKVQETGFPRSSLFHGDACLGLKRHLLERITGIFSVPIHTTFLAYKAFQAFSPANFSQATEASATKRSKPPSQFYESYVQQQGRDGLRGIFRRYPVAARLVAQATEFWLESTTELLARFEHDHEELSQRFNGGQPLANVISIQSGCSDLHNRGRSVAFLVFSDGLKLVYKPRSMRVDQTFFDLVSQLNAAGLKPELRVLNVLDRGSYGWMEFAEHVPCLDQRAAKRYYRRAGSLICLTSWLHGIDGHSENLVAAGEYPVLVDLETLAHPLRPDGFASQREEIAWDLTNPILRTGFLPVKDRRPGGHSSTDHSGLDGAISWISPLTSIRWERVNTDEVSWTPRRSTLRRSSHRAMLGKRLLSMRAFEPELLKGFRRMVRLLTGPAKLDFLQCRASIYRSIRRRVVNSTLVYGATLKISLAPQHLVSGVDRSIELLALPIKQESDWPDELAQLERLDIPYFQLAPSSTENEYAGNAPPNAVVMREQTNLLKLAIRRKLSLWDGGLSLQ